jgi:hypothetical protein
VKEVMLPWDDFMFDLKCNYVLTFLVFIKTGHETDFLNSFCLGRHLLSFQRSGEATGKKSRSSQVRED